LYQREGIADVLVVGDGFSAPTRELVEFYETLGLPCRYQATVQTRDWGHSQVNWGLQNVRGDYVTYQDDDDIYLPRALEEMVRLVNTFDSPRPLLGRVKTPSFGLLWQRPDTTTCLDGHCIVAPNDKKKLGWMASVHSGDQGLLHTTLRNYPEWAWTDRIWTLTRPEHWPLDVYSCVKRRSSSWEWTFERPPHHPIRLRMDKGDETDRMFVDYAVRPDDMTLAEAIQVAEFAVYACQGNDCWFRFDDTDELIRSALIACNYKEHTANEFTHDWPPDFWPPLAPFDHTVNPDTKEKLDDYRDDCWGGRPVA
jgi:hypothetical protein